MIEWTPIIVAGVTSLGGVAGAYFAVRKGNLEQEIKNAQREQKQQDALDVVMDELSEVKKRLDSHNGYAEKFASASKDIALLQKDTQYIKDEIKYYRHSDTDNEPNIKAGK